MKVQIQLTVTVPSTLTAKTGPYQAHLRKLTNKVGRFKAVINGDDKISIVSDVFHKLSLMSSDSSVWLPMLEVMNAPTIDAVVLRSSNGVALMYWPAYAALLCYDGAPSLSPGTKISLTPREEKTQKILAAERMGAPWIHPLMSCRAQLIEQPEVESQDRPSSKSLWYATRVGPMSVTIRKPVVISSSDVGVINSAYFQLNVLERP